MGKQTLYMLLILVAILGFVGCQRVKPTPISVPDTVAPTATPEEMATVRFALDHAVGEITELQTQEPFTVTVENCAGDEALTREHNETYVLPTDYVVDAEGMPSKVAEERAAMEAFIANRYDLKNVARQRVEQAVTLKILPQTRAVFRLQWQQVWDSNALTVSAGGETVATLPLSVPVSAELRVTSSQQQPCVTHGEEMSETVSLPEIIVPERTPGIGTWTPGPGSEKSIALVRHYLDLLAREEHAAAYDLLHPVYQDALPYKHYVAGYGPLEEIEVQAIESTSVGQYKEVVHVGMLVGTEKEGEFTYSHWEGVFEVVIARGKPPYQRRISDVEMQKLDAE